MTANTRTPTIVLILAWALLGFFNAIAFGLFLWAGATLKPSSDDAAGFTFVSVILAWVGDLVAIVLGIVGAWSGRERAGAILLGVLAVVIALGSAVVAPLSAFARFVASAPVPIH